MIDHILHHIVHKVLVAYGFEKPFDCKTMPSHIPVSYTHLDVYKRQGPGTDYAKTGKFTGKGVFTIVEVQSGQGSSDGWGRLKSGAGWISLDYAVKTE